MYARGEGDRPPPGTLNHLFFDSARRYNKPDAMMVRVDAKWQPISHATILERVRRIALGLSALGVARGDRVAILSENRPEWAIADYACLTAESPTCRSIRRCRPSRSRTCSRTPARSRSSCRTTAQAAKIASIRGAVPGAAARHRVRRSGASRRRPDARASSRRRARRSTRPSAPRNTSGRRCR